MRDIFRFARTPRFARHSPTQISESFLRALCVSQDSSRIKISLLLIPIFYQRPDLLESGKLSDRCFVCICFMKQ
jgi:hypothetical protein